MKIVSVVYFSLLITGAAFLWGCSAQENMGKKSITSDTIRLGSSADALVFRLDFVKGDSHNHPTFAIWLEDMDQNYLSTLFVTRSIATGIYGHGPIQKEIWDNKPGPQKRPATLPYWLHKRSATLNLPLLPDSEHPVVDGYSGATPQGNFVLESPGKGPMPKKFRILMEINQPWDWNEFWTNALYNDPDYRTSCQPSVVYSVSIDLDHSEKEYYLNPIGHGHFAGKDGKLYTDLRTLTTALNIIDHVRIQVIHTK